MWQLPTFIADNAGYDSSELISQLKALHAKGKTNAGLGKRERLILIPLLLHIDMTKGCVGDMDALGVKESFLVKRQVLLSAAEAAEMILRVDDIIKSAPRFANTVTL